MKISAYTYVRNGLYYRYPFIQAIRSVLPIVDEFVVVLGDSTDGSRRAILNMHSAKVRIVDTVWDVNLREGGKLFAQQSNVGLDEVSGDWVIHVQADEVIHENDLACLKEAIYHYHDNPLVEGLLLPFYHFRGDYSHIQTGRTRHRFEIRAFRRNPLIRSYRDSQGFRKYSSCEAYAKGEKGKKLNVVKVDVPVYHYSHVRPPEMMLSKARYFACFYHDDATVESQFEGKHEFDYSETDRLEDFKGSHPSVMQEVIQQKDWQFCYDPSKARVKWRHRLLNGIEKITGWRIGEYRNYVLLDKLYLSLGSTCLLSIIEGLGTELL